MPHVCISIRVHWDCISTNLRPSLASQTVTQAEEQSGHMSQVSVAPNGETIA